MADIVGAGLGAALGSIIPGVGWQLGMSIGTVLGGLFVEKPKIEGARLTDLKASGATQAAAIPIVFGSVRIPGNIVWQPDLHESSSDQGGGGSFGGPTYTNYSYTEDFALQFCQGEITRFNRIWADSELIYDYNSGTPIWSEFIEPTNVEFLLGSFSQAVPAVIAAERTAAGDEGLAYLGRALIVFESFPWSHFGHQANITAEVVRGTSVTLASILTELFELVEIPSGQLDMTALSGIVVEGFVISSRSELLAAIEGLLRAYNADVVEVDGKLVGVLKDVAPSFTLDEKWLGCVTDGDAPSEKVETVRKQELEMPRSVDVTYMSAAHDYQQFTQRALRLTVASQGEHTMDLPLVLTDDHARHIAETALYEDWEARDSQKTSYPLNYLSIAPGDVGILPIGGVNYTVRATEQTMGMFGHIDARFVRHESAVYTQFVAGASPPTGTAVTVSGDFTCWARDINALTDYEADFPVVYGAGTRNQSGWPGFPIWTAPLTLMGYDMLAHQTPFVCDQKAVIGAITGSIPSVNTPNQWDRVSTFDVVLVQGELVSASEAEVLNGANMCVIGDEILQFATATLIAPLTYRISTLIRGRRGTEWAIPTHLTGDPFVLVNSAIERFPYATSMRNYTPTFTGLINLFGQSYPSNAVVETLECTSRKPYSPCDIRATRDGSGNLTLTWKRRARKATASPFQEPPLDETSELYEVDILNALGSAVLRTITVTAQTASYLAADQTTDFGSPQSSINIRVYQVSPGWIRGAARAATV